MTKKRLIVSYKNLTPEVLKAINEKYPDGFSDHLIKINKNDKEFFYSISLETVDTIYLIKVDVEVRKESNSDDDDDDSFEDIETTPVVGNDEDFDNGDVEDDQDDEYPDKPVDDFDDDDDK